MRGVFRDATNDDYFEGVQRRIMKVSQTARVVIACDREKPWYIYGYCVAETPSDDHVPLVVHYTFVKNPFRRQGIATEMLKAHGWYRDRIIVATHWNYYLKDIRKVVRLRFNPWLLDAK
jgi:hypothetical protein